MAGSVFEVLRRRRSIRAYREQDIPSEVVERIITAAFFSPSSRNRRPWHFVLTTDEETTQRLSKVTQENSSFASGAPLVIAVCADARIASRWIEDCSIASIIIQLTAAELGLGSCWIQIRGNTYQDGRSAEDYVREVLNIPSSMRVLCLLSLGYPDEEKTPHLDQEFMPERVHWESF
ncbi:MAG: nitroreductase family protein [Thermoplasmata archaeon]